VSVKPSADPVYEKVSFFWLVDLFTASGGVHQNITDFTKCPCELNGSGKRVADMVYSLPPVILSKYSVDVDSYCLPTHDDPF